MPIPGPSTTVAADLAPIPTGSPFHISLHGSWLQLEGVTPTVTTASERPGSEMVSVDGNRYVQRGRRVRRSWEVSIPHAAAANLAALRVAADSRSEVWLVSDAVTSGNMLANRDCWGSEATLIDCAGLSLPAFTAGSVVTGRVRGGVPTTVSCWTDVEIGGAVQVTYPGGVVDTASAGGPPYREAVTFTPSSDGVVSIEMFDSGVSGLMLTEGATAPEVFVPGESMPCKVVVDDPGDVLTMFHTGAWRHEYSVSLREVG